MGRLGKKKKKKRKVWELVISYVARDCHSHSLSSPFQERDLEERLAYGVGSRDYRISFDTYGHVAVISDLVTMTIGIYKLVAVVEIYSGCRIRSSIDLTGWNDKTTKCRQMCKFSDDAHL